MDDKGAFLPPALARLVESKAQSQSLEQELFGLFLRGRKRVTLGLGPGVDLPLLPEELSSIGSVVNDRLMVVATVRADPEGYTVERPITNFGLFVRNPSTGTWLNVPQGGEQRNLVPGDVIGLGSTPADCVRVTLPEGPWISIKSAPRSARHAQYEPGPSLGTARPFVLPESPVDLKSTPDTPPTHGPHQSYKTDPPKTNPGVKVTPAPAGSSRGAPPGGMVVPDKLPSREYEPLFRLALLHWRYNMITFGGDPKAVVHLRDPSLARLRAALMRNCDQPDRGYELFVKDPDPDLWVEPRGEPLTWVRKGGALKLRGPGNRIGFGRFVLELPAPAVVEPRFGPRVVPTPDDIAVVLELTLAELADAEVVKARHRELVRRFHPDRTDGDPGHTSRFVEIQAAFDAWKAKA